MSKTIYRVDFECCEEYGCREHVGVYDNKKLAEMAADASGGSITIEKLNKPPKGTARYEATYFCTIYFPFGEIEERSIGPSFSSFGKLEGTATLTPKAFVAVSFISPEKAKEAAIEAFEKWQKQVSRKTWEGK